jgi:hypothetical protein
MRLPCRLQTHWQNAYQSKGERDVSWFQETSAPSLELIDDIGTAWRTRQPRHEDRCRYHATEAGDDL